MFSLGVQISEDMFDLCLVQEFGKYASWSLCQLSSVWVTHHKDDDFKLKEGNNIEVNTN